MNKRSEHFLFTAPGSNLNAVVSKELVPLERLQGGTGKPLPAHLGDKALMTLVERRDQHLATKGAPVKEVAELRLNSRRELVSESAMIITRHAEQYGAADMETIHHAALAGCGDIVAMLELVARMQAGICEDAFNADTYSERAKKSLRTLLDMAATSNEADGVLTTNISTWTREEIKQKSDEELYGELQFDDSFFLMQDDGAVVLRNDDATRKRILTVDGKNFDFSPNKNLILFGCPFRQQLSLLYPPMVTAMINNGFAEAAYNSGRK